MKKSFKLAALFVAAAISVAVVSCNKDKETEEPVASQSQNSEAKELLNRIYAFQELRDNVDSGAKSGESMTLEELRDNIDLTFNFEHSQHATPFDYATLDTFYVRMPQVDVNGNVSAADAIATYNTFETSLEHLLVNVEDGMDVAKCFSIKFPEVNAKGEDLIQVIFTRGEGDDLYTSSSPFQEGDDYKWGKSLGYCDNISAGRNTDAATELTRVFKYKPDEEHEGMISLIMDVEYVGYKSYEDPQNIYPRHIYYYEPTLQCGHNWAFYFVGSCDEEPCIEFEEMNCYNNSKIRIFESPTGALHWGPTSGSPFHECIIEATEENMGWYCIKIHLYNVRYCKVVTGSHE